MAVRESNVVDINEVLRIREVSQESQAQQEQYEPTKEEAVDIYTKFVANLIADYYGDCTEDREVSAEEIAGFTMSIASYYRALEQGLFPEVIRSPRVEAQRAYERLVKYNNGLELPQDFYIGYMKGFVAMLER